MVSLKTVQCTIPAGATMSDAADCRGSLRILRVLMPDAWTRAQLTFQLSVDGVTWGDLYHTTPENFDPFEVIVPEVIPGSVVTMPGNMSSTVYFARIRSGPHAAQVRQAADRKFTLVLEMPSESGGEGGVGPEGPTGPTGPAGGAETVGPTGAEGPQGPMGLAGPEGPQGPQGQDGKDGKDGKDGDPGPEGPVGPAGPEGSQGPQGVQGIQGQDGAAGPEGQAGQQGPQGAQGIQGAQGAAGTGITFKGSVPTVDDLPDPAAQGDAWIVEADDSLWVHDGVDFVSGGSIQGPPGAQGPQGAQGVAGLQGPQGVVGPQGVAGSVGPIGPTGSIGSVGATGAPGAVGGTGAAGAVGPTGATGAQGAVPAGATGPNAGWQQIGNIIQNWGFVNASTAGVDVVFPRPYVNDVPAVSTSGQSGGILQTVATKTGFNVKCNSGTPIVYWHAIGS